MSQATFELDDNTEAAIDQLKTFFKVKSRSQAIRSAIALAGAIAPTSKGNVVVVKDQNDNSDLKIVVAN